MEESKKKYFELLSEKMANIENLKADCGRENVNQWKNEVMMILDNLIGEDSKYYKKFEHITFEPMVIGVDEYDYEEMRKERVKSDLDDAQSLIKSILYGVENNLV